MQNSGTPLVVAAVILAVAVLGGALIMKSSMDAGTAELAGVKSSLVEFKDALAAAARPAQPAAQRPSGPDPARKYSVNLNGTAIKGPAGAKVTVVEFSDFQCPFCKRVGPTLEQVEKAYSGKVRIAFKHLPLPMHPMAESAARAAEAAHKQGKFWEMHDKLFADQQALSEQAYEKHAKDLGLDVDRFKKDFASAEVKARVDADMKEANQLGVNGTPGFFVNGRFLSGAQPFEAFKALIDQELAQAG